MGRMFALAVLFSLVSCKDDDHYTKADCEADGGTVVSDIGDGSTREPGYTCPNGTPPLGRVTTKDGKPVAEEGAVCCGS